VRWKGKGDIGKETFVGVHCAILPNIPFGCLEDTWTRRIAVRGFLRAREEYTDETICAAYSQYALRQRKNLLPEIFAEDRVPALAFYAEQQKITAANFDEAYMTPAVMANATECVAFLLEWSSRNISQDERDKQQERELTKDPLNATDMKKLWSYKTQEDGTLVLTAYKGEEEAVFVPERIGTKSVTALGDNVFSLVMPNGSDKPAARRLALLQIMSADIPDSVTSIGNAAFKNCRGLKRVALPDSVIHIGADAFCGCPNLADSQGFVIVRNLLYNYYGKQWRITVPSGVTVIGDTAFWGCKRLLSVTLPDSVTHIGKEAFIGCGSMTKIILPDSIKSIGTRAFLGCANLTMVTIPSGVTELNDELFRGCDSLRTVVIPDGVTHIGYGVFQWCRNLTNITIPDSVTYIGDTAFSGCANLADDRGFVIVRNVLYSYHGPHWGISVPDGVTQIGNDAFAACIDMTEITLPASVTSIGDAAFERFEQLTIHAPAGSFAEIYAAEHKIPFAAE
jgi:hypothetical protein